MLSAGNVFKSGETWRNKCKWESLYIIFVGNKKADFGVQTLAGSRSQREPVWRLGASSLKEPPGAKTLVVMRKGTWLLNWKGTSDRRVGFEMARRLQLKGWRGCKIFTVLKWQLTDSRERGDIFRLAWAECGRLWLEEGENKLIKQRENRKLFVTQRACASDSSLEITLAKL